MNLSSHVEEDKVQLQVAPLIDVVFLLLIYFIMTATLIKKEGDISFMLPSKAPPQELVRIPIEVIIQITEDGAVITEGIRYSQNDEELKDLVKQLVGLKEVADSQQSPFYVNILPTHETIHSRVIDVMDACAEAKVEKLSFSKAAE